MGIFSRIFKGGPPDGRDEDKEGEERSASSDGVPDVPVTEAELTEPAPAPNPALAAATLGGGGAGSPFSTPLWSWPQRGAAGAAGGPGAGDEPPPGAPAPAGRPEAPAAKPEDAAAKSRAAIPSVAKRGAGVETPAPAAPQTPATPPAPSTPSAAAPKGKGKEAVAVKDKNDSTMVMSPPPPAATAPTRPTPAPTPATPAPATPAAIPAPSAAQVRSRATSTPPARTPTPPAASAPPAPAPSSSPAAPPAAAAKAPPAPSAPVAAAPAAPAAPAAAPPASASAQTSPSGRARSDTLDALDEVVLELQSELSGAFAAASSPSPVQHGVSTAEDLAAVRALFHDVAVAHVAQVRDVMLELRYGEANPKWIELTKPALRSLRAMAGQMELTDLCEALDAFCDAVDASVANRAFSDEDKAELLRRYERLVELIPQAFELDAEHDRREPIIVQALLSQIDGVERPTIDKLFGVGLGRLEALMSANATDVAAVTGIRPALAAAIVAQFKTYRASATATISAPDAAAERRQLADLLIMLTILHDDFEKASGEWGDDAAQRKRSLRKQREQTFQQIKVGLARLGERDQLQRLEKLPFQERIAVIDRYLSSQQARPST
jgi:hypothetical protein